MLDLIDFPTFCQTFNSLLKTLAYLDITNSATFHRTPKVTQSDSVPNSLNFSLNVPPNNLTVTCCYSLQIVVNIYFESVLSAPHSSTFFFSLLHSSSLMPIFFLLPQSSTHSPSLFSFLVLFLSLPLTSPHFLSRHSSFLSLYNSPPLSSSPFLHIPLT